jgi:uncharacterized protein (TIGR00251 family)
MPPFADALTEDRNGTLIAVEVTAGAKNGAFPSGYNEWRKTIGCRVSAPALEGRANKAVISLVAKTLSVPSSAVSIKSGATSSIKYIHITGLTAAETLARLDRT